MYCFEKESMKRIITAASVFCLLLCFAMYSMPGNVIAFDSESKVAFISLESIDLASCIVLHEFKLEDLPVPGNDDIHTEFHQNANRIVYATKDKKCVLKIWQKNYFHAQQFLLAYRAHFFEGIAPLIAIILDRDGECRGYVTSYMIDRCFNRQQWNSYGFVLEKNKIGVNIFAPYDQQPAIYKNLFDRLLEKTQDTGLVMMDFCPNNCVVDPESGALYISDLEDVDSIATMQDLMHEIYVYNPRDYVSKICIEGLNRILKLFSLRCYPASFWIPSCCCIIFLGKYPKQTN